MRVDLPHIHVAMPFHVVAPPAEKDAENVELFGARISNTVAAEMQRAQPFRLGRLFDDAVEFLHQGGKSRFSADPVDETLRHDGFLQGPLVYQSEWQPRRPVARKQS